MSARQIVIRLLEQWNSTDTYADILLDRFFKEKKIKSSDRALVQEIFFGVIRWQNQLNWIIEHFFQGNIGRAPRFIRYILQSGIYQLLYLQKVPDYAIVNEAVRLARKRGGNFWARKVNAILRNFIRNSEQIVYPDSEKEIADFIAVRYSHPRWLVDRWLKRWGADETIALCQKNNERPAVSLRINQLRIAQQEMTDFLLKQGVEFSQVEDMPDFFQISSFQEIGHSEFFRKGYFSVQDASAGLACRLLAPQPNEQIVDLCAAPGGKSSYLLELSQGKATVLSADINFQRLQLVKQNLARLNFPTNRLIQVDAANFASQRADKILIDAPCSGLGVLSKRVDLRWRRTVDEMQELPNLQFSILENAAKLIQSGGVIVYATCTIEPEENELVVQKFLEIHQEFEIDNAGKYVPDRFVSGKGWVQTYPHRHGVDGSFAVRLKRK
ncbi:16S rRNA (cytosine(967)-C(5))-methyltransferase [candidate division KSB1 bacterium 4484_87]|nr:MAG: 16S rRNA (cytosine(967)-C(5))-methyltransferase [candidate division KSB1 bacterium 4484_87]